MEETRKELEVLFDEMLGSMKYFKKRTYESFFKQSCDRYQSLLASLAACSGEEAEEEAVEELASVIPMYARRKLLDVPKRKKEIAGIDYNMTMAVYIIPMLVYGGSARTNRIAARMVEIWNENKVTGFKLQMSDYEKIAGGFRKRLFFLSKGTEEDRR